MKIIQYCDIDDKDMWRMAKMSLYSIRQNIPNSTIQIVGTAESIAGARLNDVHYDTTVEICRVPNVHYAYNRCASNYLANGDVLDISNIFDDATFDLAATRRWPVISTSYFNWGICFCRNHTFWMDAIDLIDRTDNSLDPTSVERCCTKLARNKQYIVKELSGQIYNRFDYLDADDMKDTAIIHFKGERKKRMEHYFHKYFPNPFINIE
jgi:hypothetical protein